MATPALVYTVIAGLHALGIGLFLHYCSQYPALTGLGAAAYLFGLRHAFDPDHIAAIDDTVRYMMSQGGRPLAVGFFFSLGHSTVVFALAVAIALASAGVGAMLPQLREVGGIIGAGISGVFLWIVGILNLFVVFDLVRAWRGNHGHTHVEVLLQPRGFTRWLFGGRLTKLMSRAWQMFPLGLLFGLGFDTASEIGLLAITAGAATGDLPIGAVLSLPLLFAAGMTAMDTTDGVLVCKTYEWALRYPAGRVVYNIATTSLTLAIALVVGTVELLQVVHELVGHPDTLFGRFQATQLQVLGYAATGLLLVLWAVSVWRRKRRREGDRPQRSAFRGGHSHTHLNGLTHTHAHSREATIPRP